jgi:hypothetical protein
MHGPHKITWPLPKGGSYEIVLSAKSLNGVSSETSLTVEVPPRSASSSSASGGARAAP